MLGAQLAWGCVMLEMYNDEPFTTVKGRRLAEAQKLAREWVEKRRGK